MVDSELHFLLNCFLSNFYGCNHMVLNWFSLQYFFIITQLQEDCKEMSTWCVFSFFFLEQLVFK